MWMFRGFLIHNHIPTALLLSNLLPIIKDKLGSVTSSANYHSVCITSLILKEFDWVTLCLYGDKLEFNDLQFAYQEKVSSSMCTWAVLETISYFLQKDSEIFLCSMDKSKAFDLCQYGTLFKLFQGKIGLVFLRLIIFIYTNQRCRVIFNNLESSEFRIMNGVGQGKNLASYAYCY